MTEKQHSYRIPVYDGFGRYRVGEKLIVNEQIPGDADDAQQNQREEELNMNAHTILAIQLAKTNTSNVHGGPENLAHNFRYA